MKPGSALLALFLLALLASPGIAAPGPVTWKARIEPADARAGESAQVVLEATVEAPWHVYSLTPRTGPGPKPTSIELEAGGPLTAEGAPVQPEPHRELDRGFNIQVEFYPGQVAFGLPVRIADRPSGTRKASLKLRYMACKEGQCTPPLRTVVPIAFVVSPGPPRPDRGQPVTTVPEQPSGYEPPKATVPTAGAAGVPATTAGQDVNDQIRVARSQGLLAFLGLSIVMGFLALLTPCVFPMVPITVSFFAKQQESAPGSGLRGAVAYCLGIILTFTALGLATSALFGAGAIARFATNPIVNLALAALFVVMAVNLFGGFEIMLPSWLVEKTAAGSRRGGLVGPMLMGLTFTITSFTCTFAFVGGLLATTTQGSFLWPVLGMLGFSTAFASPFFLLALFPEWLAKLPKSGSWLVTVKAFMGFLELAAALKFLSNADLVWNWELITRPVFLSIWFAIFAVAALYLFGWLRLPHDAESPVGIPRRVVGIATAVLAAFCLAAMNGVSLGQVNGFLPPREYGGTGTVAAAAGDVRWLEDYDDAVRQAKAEGKPIFIDFTGVTCTNCRVMEDTVFPVEQVARELRKFVTVRLFTDREDAASRRYQELQLREYGQTTLPLYVTLSPDGRKLGTTSFNPDAGAFAGFLRDSLDRMSPVASAR